MDSASGETDGFMYHSLDAGDANATHQLFPSCRTSAEHDSLMLTTDTSEEEDSDDGSLLDVNTNKNGDKRRKSHFHGRRLSKKSLAANRLETIQEEEEAFVQGSKHMIMIFVPVTMCMLLVVLTIGSISYYTEGDIYLVYTPFHDKTEDTTTIVWQSTANAAIFLCVIIAMTLMLLLLYTFRFYKFINAWLMIASVFLLFFFGFIYLQQMLRAFNVPMDYITISLLLWNFGICGIFCIHWKGPLILQQAYLIATSALVALTFIKHMPDWTTWSVLTLLVFWDLFAVLCPQGPLRLFLETAEQRNETVFPFPALIYSSTMMWQITMADSDQTRQEKKPKPINKSSEKNRQVPAQSSAKAAKPPTKNAPMPSSGTQLPSTSAQIQSAGEQIPIPKTDVKENGDLEKKASKSLMNEQTCPDCDDSLDCSGVDLPDSASLPKDSFQSDVDDPHRPEDGSSVDPVKRTSNKRKKGNSKSLHPAHTYRASRRCTKHSIHERPKPVVEYREEKGVKLGLGDFVFYAVLVGKASSKGDWNTTIACFVAILIGLCFTLLLLATFRKALPALPISLTFGLVFNFTTRILVKPFMESLASGQVYI